MAESDTKPTQKTATSAMDELEGEDFLTFAKEYEEDRKHLRWAFALAIVFHLIFFAVKLPEIIAETPEPEKKKV